MVMLCLEKKNLTLLSQMTGLRPNWSMSFTMWKARQLFLAYFRGFITANAMKRWSSDWKPTLMIPIVAER